MNDDQAHAALRRMAQISHQMTSAMAAFGETMRHAMTEELAYERAMGRARALGLTEDQAREVIDAYRAGTLISGTVHDWELINEAMTRRALGQEWRP